MCNKKIFYYLNKARIEAKKSIYKKTQIGAVVVNKRTIVGRGYNQLRHNKIYTLWANSLHAEIDAIKDTPISRLGGSILFVYRETAKGELALAKPCIYCMAAIKDKKIKTIVYTTNNGYEIIKV